MKKALKIVLGVIITLIIVAAAVVAWQWDNINAFYMSVVYDETQIQKKLEDNKKNLAESLKQEERSNSSHIRYLQYN